jgi:kelch-like protein 1/4/5
LLYPLSKFQPFSVFQFIIDQIEREPLFFGDEKSRELIMEAMKYYLLPERRAALSSQRTTPRKSTVGKLCAVGGIDASKGQYKINLQRVKIYLGTV